MTCSGHTASVTSVAFSPDEKGGERVLTGSEDYSIKLWETAVTDQEAVSNTKAAREILTLTGHKREVTSVTFSPNGQHVLTGSRDGKSILWLATDWTKTREAVVQTP